MATFAAVNTPATLGDGLSDVSDREHTATTVPRTTTTVPETLEQGMRGDESSPNTPTRHSFGGVLGQRPLPDGPLTTATRVDESQDSDGASQPKRSMGDATAQPAADMEDVEMEDGDDEGFGGDDAGSGNESVTSDTQRPAKKKKGQRFFCTDYPPCQLSFTRSEHLARHIRKHTGERPFQCHCSRRFSRLDNLRQHAQTVHVNEEIPGDSLAAQSTRFQRQIRTDKVRPTSSRSRASTAGSQGGHSRGHSRNLSTSSIGSTTSSIGPTDEGRRRPQPLAMASDSTPRTRPLVEALSSSSKVATTAGPQFAYYKPSPSGYSTPTSTAFSPGNASPQHPSAVVSPSSTVSRSSFYNGNRTHARRLSVPSTQRPYQHPGGTYPPPFMSPMTPTSNAAFSPTSQVFASPTSSVFSHSRRDSESEMDYRRRTWHPSTNPFFMQRPATSGLTYHQTPDEPRPAFTQQSAASQVTRLPGIESFDHAPPPAARQQPPSPMMVDVAPRPPSSGRPSDGGLQQGLTRLDIAAANAADDQSHVRKHAPSAQGLQFVHSNLVSTFQFPGPQRMSMPEQPVTPRKAKRNAWYGGPVGPISSPQATHVTAKISREDSGSSDGNATPSTTQNTDFRPNTVATSAVPEAYSSTPALSREQYAYQGNAGQPQKITPVRSDSGFHGPPQQDQIQPQPTSAQQYYALQSGHDPRLAHSHYHPPPSNDMTKLEALVAVAASQNRAVEHTT